MKKSLYWVVGIVALVACVFWWKKSKGTAATKATVDNNLANRPAALPGTSAQQAQTTNATAKAANDYIGVAGNLASFATGLFKSGNSASGTRSPSTSGSGSGAPISQADYDANAANSDSLFAQSQAAISAANDTASAPDDQGFDQYNEDDFTSD